MTSSEIVPKSEDVRLACAFIADADKRADILALFAFLETLRDIPERVSDPLMGEIRLRWWYEAIEEIEQGRAVRYHPLTEVLNRLVDAYGLAPKAFYDLIEGQMPLLDKGQLTVADALSVVDRGEGAVLRLACEVLGKPTDLTDVARLYGMAQIKASRGLSDGGDMELAHLRREAMKTQGLSADIMPLALPAVLAADYWQGRTPGPLSKRVRLLWAFITGKI
ncbi:squalene/phytoene synthase family protein [Asticcacaulis sp. 201]|uniref:squalene/phytoene synthase family protein n=1 Tax=Asticcacaulis sp. 201 TaxID=3028787 RepID=UPI002915F2D5|nr:squalene/phytoene synthase family protein [Asticcacaulis sp. 201]MDV6329629.1 squalene/phytoene synthase family protein [Asticcacaulis sp. 201]